MSNDAAQRAFQSSRLKKKQKVEADLLFPKAAALHQAGRSVDAASLYRQVLALRPEHFDAVHMLGLCELDAGNCEDAERLVRQALQINPRSADAHSNLGIILFETKRYDEAHAAYRRAVSLNPRYAVAFNNLGNACKELGLLDEALESYDKSIALKSDYSNAHCNRGLLMSRWKRWEDALLSYDRAILFNGRNADAFCNRGNALLELLRPAEALPSFDKALIYNPRMIPALSGRATALVDLRQFDEAFATFQRALDIDPRFPQTLINRASLWIKLKKFDKALADVECATAHPSQFAAAYVTKASALLHSNRLAEAFASCEQAIALDPTSFQAYTALGGCHARLGEVGLAITNFDKALAIQPNFPEAIGNRIFALDFVPGATVAQHQDARSIWWERIGAKLAARPAGPHLNAPDPGRRLRIGYVSGDFRSHSAGFAFRPILQNHNKDRFEVICYSCSTIEDAVTQQFREVANIWRDAARWSDDMLTEQIVSDGIDILVDLAGHSEGNRLDVFARKPAPVQVTAWGHATGTGLCTMDYFFADPVLIPPDERHLFAEAIYDLPCVVTLEPLPNSVTLADTPALSKGEVTFGCFNRINKLSNESISVWAKILELLPNSKLMIKDPALDDSSVRADLQFRLGRFGVAPDRIALLGRTSRIDHLEKFNDVDICLDSFPQNGGVSTWEALRMGVPVVALRGISIPSRIGAAILASIGMRDWIADSIEEYVTIAVERGRDVESLARIRREQPGRIDASAAGNMALYTKAVETAYRTMWETWCVTPPTGGKAPVL
jgi:predicted O-linked N-acetylglucosamine transferase (SPINDLY family)